MNTKFIQREAERDGGFARNKNVKMPAFVSPHRRVDVEGSRIALFLIYFSIPQNEFGIGAASKS